MFQLDLGLLTKYKYYYVAVGLVILVLLGMCVLFPAQLSVAGKVVRTFLFGPPENVVLVQEASPDPSPLQDPLAEKVSTLEAELRKYKEDQQKVHTELALLRSDFQQAISEVAGHNDLLEKKSRELTQALAGVGLAPFPVSSEPSVKNKTDSAPTASQSSKVAINTASATELMQLPGIGKTYADRIIAYRTEHGPFQAIEDLMLVSGIGPATFEKLRDLVRL